MPPDGKHKSFNMNAHRQVICDEMICLHNSTLREMNDMCSLECGRYSSVWIGVYRYYFQREGTCAVRSSERALRKMRYTQINPAKPGNGVSSVFV